MTVLTLCRVVEMLGAIVLAGAANFRWLAGSNAPPRPARRLAAMAFVTVGAAGVVRLWLTAAEMSGQPPAAAWSMEILHAILLETRFGHVWLIRFAALIFLGGLLAARRGDDSRAGHLAIWLLTMAVLVVPQWAGHAGASEHRAWLLPVNVLHAAAAGMWPGGLPFLAILLVRAASGRVTLASTIAVTRRFSTASVVAVGTLALTGLMNAWGMIGTLTALTGGFYGRMLLLKVAIFAGMAALGVVNRRLVGRLPTGAGDATALATLRRNVGIECVLAVVVLMATEILATSAPPA